MTIRFLLACGLSIGGNGIEPVDRQRRTRRLPGHRSSRHQPCGWDPAPPPAPPAPPGVSVTTCQDGAFDFAQQPNYRSTCAENGGVAKWMTG